MSTLSSTPSAPAPHYTATHLATGADTAAAEVSKPCAPSSQPTSAAAWSGWLPSQCEVCRRWNAARLCADCRARHAAPCPRCARCGLRTGVAVASCGECLRDPPPFRHTHCAVDYGFPWSQLLQAFKFQGQDDLSGPLAQLLADALRENLARTPALPLPDLLLPVPLSTSRLRERGYNQAWELARQLGRRLDRPARPDGLLRAQQGPTQAELTRAQRQRNLRGAFHVTPSAAAGLQGLHVALVDDVMTTGATVREAASTLLHAGAATVDVWVVARTPAPSI